MSSLRAPVYKQTAIQGIPTQEVRSTSIGFPGAFARQLAANKIRCIALIFLLLAVILGSVWGISRASGPGESGPTGQIHFGKSVYALAGSYDTIQIDLRNVPRPQAGHFYFAWLVSNNLEGDTPHWQLTYLDNQTIHTPPLRYKNVSNLLVADRYFLVTDEKTDTPVVPYVDPSARLYYASLIQTTSPVFDVMRCPSDNTVAECAA